MEKSIFAFIWKYSKREQIFLLFFTAFTFPFLYVTLELPKRIINDAIGSESSTVDLLGVSFSQIQFLMILCFLYLAAVLCHGLLKMRLNTVKGVLAERMLRRFRFTLLKRMTRFPSSYFRTTSQGELVSMITSEAEPMGGLMGDAVAQPMFQAGQMLIIVIFLFMQSFWFGLAGVALIPLQAYVIPILQRQINQLNKQRIIETRHFAGDIGETAAGITDLRTNGGLRYRLASFTDRLGRLFLIRFQIYQKKFFMKFLNNFITQLTPFFFYSVGGYLTIQGEITVGALVAALAAYKDLSAPWKELLIYYNQVQDMSLRWEIVVERFDPKGILDEKLFEGEPDEIPHLNGAISIKNVTVRNADGNAVLENISLDIPAGARVAIKVGNQLERTAFAELLTREVIPSRGSVTMTGHDLNSLHQSVIAARIGYAHSRPYLFQGTIGDNLLMSLRSSPKTVDWNPDKEDRALMEARRSGNSLDSISADWLDPGIAGLTDPDEIRSWWFQLAQALGTDQAIFRRMMQSRMNPALHPRLASTIVGLRDEVHAKLKERGLMGVVHRFDPDKFNPTIPLGGNLMFSSPVKRISQEGLASERGLIAMMAEVGLAEQAIAISQTLIETLHQTFGMDGTNHPLFTSLNIDEDLYERLVDIAFRRREKGDEGLTEKEFALLLTVPFAFTAEQIGPAFPESFKREIVNIRKQYGAEMREKVRDLFVPISPENYLPRMTILENMLYGRISSMAGVQGELVVDIVAEVMEKHGLRRLVAETAFDIPTTLAGGNLSTILLERTAFSRAGIKRPDILILDQALASSDAARRQVTRAKLAELLPNTTQIFMEENFESPEAYDLYVEIKNGRIGTDKAEDEDEDEKSGDSAEDLRRKLRIISRTELFENLGSRSQRLLAFSARWFEVPAGDRVFARGERADAAYLCLSGRGEMQFVNAEGQARVISVVEKGRLIGDLSIILDDPRQLDLVAETDMKFLRIGAEQFRSVIESDPVVLLSLLRTVARYLTDVADLLRESDVQIPQKELDTLGQNGDETADKS